MSKSLAFISSLPVACVSSDFVLSTRLITGPPLVPTRAAAPSAMSRPLPVVYVVLYATTPAPTVVTPEYVVASLNVSVPAPVLFSVRLPAPSPTGPSNVVLNPPAIVSMSWNGVSTRPSNTIGPAAADQVWVVLTRIGLLTVWTSSSLFVIPPPRIVSRPPLSVNAPAVGPNERDWMSQALSTFGDSRFVPAMMMLAVPSFSGAPLGFQFCAPLQLLLPEDSPSHVCASASPANVRTDSTGAAAIASARPCA